MATGKGDAKKAKADRGDAPATGQASKPAATKAGASASNPGQAASKAAAPAAKAAAGKPGPAASKAAAPPAKPVQATQKPVPPAKTGQSTQKPVLPAKPVQVAKQPPESVQVKKAAPVKSAPKSEPAASRKAPRSPQPAAHLGHPTLHAVPFVSEAHETAMYMPDRTTPSRGIRLHGKDPAVVRKHVRATEAGRQIEDERVGLTVEALKRDFINNLHCIQGRDERSATPHDYYMALAYSVRDRLVDRWLKTIRSNFNHHVKTVCYLSAEFLMGRQLANNLVNTGLYEVAREAMADYGHDLDDLREHEDEPGLGNGGLGRLAACYLDSLATMEVPALGYGIRYEFGIFEQEIRDGYQIERPDKWLRFGNPWEVARPEYLVEVKLYGHTETDDDGRVRWVPGTTVLGTPYDTLVPGYQTNTVNTLRLWSARASEEFNLQVFEAGDYTRAVANKTFSENISKVLYPNDNTRQGKELRLEQQYFFVSCSIQDILRRHRRHKEYTSFDNLPDKVAIQLNDTHPSVGVAEMMRLLVDEYQVPWDNAWTITTRCFGFTNHTLMAESLEKWPVDLFGNLLPRHLEIIYEINRRFLDEVRQHFPGDDELVSALSLIGEAPERHVRMAWLAAVGSHSINGVARLHTELLKSTLMPAFYRIWPDKFHNVTNGVTPRRWMLLANPKLSLLLSDKIGRTWLKDLSQLQQLEPLALNADFCRRFAAIKLDNKRDLAALIHAQSHLEIDPQSMFDIQVKRIHEYKRQLMNILGVIARYFRIRDNPRSDYVSRTVVFGGKAAPGYAMAKLIIHLINEVAAVVNADPVVGTRLRVVFLPNFNVSLGERIYKAADLSEQISTAGTEASGTGNMKFAMNGALTIGTLDGANIEMVEHIGTENFFLFGLKTDEVAALRPSYHPWDYVASNPELHRVLDAVASGQFSSGDREMFRPIIDSLLSTDPYMVLADFQAYMQCQDRVDALYRTPQEWTRQAILNVARMGYFSSDRSVKEYCQEIWGTVPVPVQDGLVSGPVEVRSLVGAH